MGRFSVNCPLCCSATDMGFTADGTAVSAVGFAAALVGCFLVAGFRVVRGVVAAPVRVARPVWGVCVTIVFLLTPGEAVPRKDGVEDGTRGRRAGPSLLYILGPAVINGKP
ncbi:hypothetical protein [Microtetraspora sp. NBRC 16547]|uniref:hypothetical protein n=1 Tax=Microtetraspora sp. NBRC 16547 TaxID=3030993 RepID=UPI0024A0822B|nr:hypothetical protein [Microtetraspora sp. NBRC 16547]GLW98613.1 hypothetical protein Misp02_27000 [Microtetraspora sp. NBRC 16547]